MSVSGYLESCRSIVGAAKSIAQMIKKEIPELYVLGNPPASVVAFASKHPTVKAHEVGDRMSKRGWHLNAIVNPDAVHIACTVRGCALLAFSMFEPGLTNHIFSASPIDSVSSASLYPSLILSSRISKTLSARPSLLRLWMVRWFACTVSVASPNRFSWFDIH